MLLAAMFALPASAQTSHVPKRSAAQPPGMTDADTARQTQATRTRVDHGGASRNPDDATNQLKAEAKRKDTLFRTEAIDRALKPWNEFKNRLSERQGFNLGIFYTALYQKASGTIANPGMADNKDEAASGILGIVGTWDLIGRGTDHPGSLTFRLNDRHRYTKVAPQSLGSEIGSLWPTTIAFNEFNMSLVELYWEQHLIKDRLVFRVGKSIPFAVHDYFKLKSPTSGFSDANFTFNPSIGWVGFAFGGGALVRPTPDFYLTGGVYEANGRADRVGIDDFFNVREYFSIVDVGWDPGYLDPSRKVKIGPFTVSDLHASFWHKDKRATAGTPEGRGVTLFGELEMGRLLYFFRYGYSEGVNGGPTPALLNHMVAGGMGIQGVFGQKNDVIGIGASWGRRELGRIDINLDESEFTRIDSGSVEQTSAQVYYRIQLTQEVHVTPSLQLIFDPVLNPDKDVIAVAGIRLRAEF